MQSEEIKKFGILMFESLSGSDTKNGKKLTEEILRYKQFEEEVLSVEYFDVNNKLEFLKLLDTKVDEAICENHFYFIHLEIHGYEGGVQLKSGENVSWEELFPFFRRLNVHYRNHLILYLGVCKSASLIQFIKPEMRAPFGSALTSAKDIKNSDLLIGFEAFYTKFFFSFDIPLSLDEYNNKIENEDSRLHLLTSENSFDMICDLERDSTDHKSLDAIIVKHLTQKVPIFKFLSIEEQSRFIEKEKKDISEDCKSNKDYFLMKDLEDIILPED